MAAKYMLIDSRDNVAIALRNLSKGDKIIVEGSEWVLKTDIPAGHKFALNDMPCGTHIIKYGYPIGHACTDIEKGEWVNEKNIKTNLEGLENYEYNPQFNTLNFPLRNLYFKGYKRSNGEVGIRNEIWIIPTVGCINGIAENLARKLREETHLKNVDAIEAYTHNYGCSQLGEDHENTRKILKNMVVHPNAGGVLIIGLGCENNQLSELRDLIGTVDDSRIKFMEVQQVQNELETGMELLREIYSNVSKDVRSEVPISELKIGLKCGGSDGLSGITANPLLGLFSDFFISQGGTTVLTEVPEMFGAERILMNRCADRNIFDKTVRMVNDFKNYFIRNNQPVYENPSPGNKQGGISTLEEKSLGCTQKCGKSMVTDVLEYGERIKCKGLNLLSAPGNDLVAATALASCGCQLVLFTTGRGTPFGTFVPTVKISTNTRLYHTKPGWIDFNAGTIIESKNMQEANEDFINFVINIANGESSCNEKNNYRGIAIFKTGVTL